VLKPDFLPGFQMSIDYYRIHIKDAIGTLTEQQVLDQCAAGNAALCQLFTVTSAGTLVVRNKTLNLSVVRVAGVDMELAYHRQIGAGQLQLRLLANHGLSNQTQAPGSPTVQLLGSTTTPKWSGVFQANYSTSACSIFAQERMIGKAKLDPNLVDGVDISYADNTTPAVFYTDVTLTYNLKTARKTQFYLTVNNLFDRDPPRSPPQVTSFAMAASSAYDQIGRYFTMGARMSF
jgi:outer membrane receptor protein involved in Fe transport